MFWTRHSVIHLVLLLLVGFFVGHHTAESCIFSELMHVLGIKSLLNLGLKGCSDTFLTMIMNFQMLQLLIDYVYLITTDILL